MELTIQKILVWFGNDNFSTYHTHTVVTVLYNLILPKHVLPKHIIPKHVLPKHVLPKHIIPKDVLQKHVYYQNTPNQNMYYEDTYSNIKTNQLSWVWFFLNFSIKSWSNFKIRTVLKSTRSQLFKTDFEI